MSLQILLTSITINGTNASTGAFVRCFDFFYDQAGRRFALRSYYDSTLTGYDTFHYVLNAQGDVVQLNYQGKQDKVYAQYTYDAWGNVLTKSGSLADLNPLRYRGYYYDAETGFYYLQSRYYDPAVKRFLNADSYGSTGQGFLGFNMFAYCNNSPVIGADHSGHENIKDIWWLGGGEMPSAFAGWGCAISGTSALKISANTYSTPCVGDGYSLWAKAAAAIGAVAMAGNCLAPAAYPEKTDEDDNKSSQTFIYRYGTTRTEKLAPTAEHGDYDGLSFSLNPPTRAKQYPVAVTTIEAVKSTGILTAVQNGTHVSIKPVNGTVIEWIRQGMGSQWSQALSGIIVVIGE